MKQAMLIENEKFAVRNVPLPETVPGEVLVKVSTVGVCGSDLHVYLGHHPRVKAPVVLGHECTGTICGSVPGTSLTEGTPVAIMPLIGCGECVHCKLNEPNLCLNRKVIGFQRPGGLAEVISVPLSNVIPLPEHLDLRLGAMYEPLAVIVHATRVTAMTPDTQVFITGAGTIGLLTALYLRHTGNYDIYLVEINPKRKQFAESLGFRVVTDIQALNDAANGKERPVVFECTGNLGVLEAALNLAPSPREVNIISTFEKSKTLGIHSFCRFETKIVGSQMYTRRDIDRAIEELSGSHQGEYAKLIVNKVFTLDEVQQAFAEAISSTDGVKVMIRVS